MGMLQPPTPRLNHLSPCCNVKQARLSRNFGIDQYRQPKGCSCINPTPVDVWSILWIIFPCFAHKSQKTKGKPKTEKDQSEVS
ncbi:hypothetical protein I7I50_08373 [Histoplasma capsulatum G186AR]|uniref:Uncharacterized protein n=1 Tax=Ajellomyces capsulatus TaxID=5037 RepID=A0A8H8CZ78_AJECA|nr:hypothetical protein I7I52_05889 [Histoplasma capsulatum]QSS73561.1 hypothetical protein I7I50_08373 [Histoplasma capsulatum G186AR]